MEQAASGIFRMALRELPRQCSARTMMAGGLGQFGPNCPCDTPAHTARDRQRSEQDHDCGEPSSRSCGPWHFHSFQLVSQRLRRRKQHLQGTRISGLYQVVIDTRVLGSDAVFF
jgi:hypothetical protein